MQYDLAISQNHYDRYQVYDIDFYPNYNTTINKLYSNEITYILHEYIHYTVYSKLF